MFSHRQISVVHKLVRAFYEINVIGCFLDRSAYIIHWTELRPINNSWMGLKNVFVHSQIQIPDKKVLVLATNETEVFRNLAWSNKYK